MTWRERGPSLSPVDLTFFDDYALSHRHLDTSQTALASIAAAHAVLPLKPNRHARHGVLDTPPDFEVHGLPYDTLYFDHRCASGLEVSNVFASYRSIVFVLLFRTAVFTRQLHRIHMFTTGKEAFYSARQRQQ